MNSGLITVWFAATGASILLIAFLFYESIKFKRLYKKSSYETEKTKSELQLIRQHIDPHFIFNALNSIQSFISSNDSFKAMTYLSKLGKFIRNILDYSGERFISLEEELDNINLYIELEKFRFNHFINFLINLDKEIKPETLLIPPLTIFPVVENKLNCDLLPTKTNALLELNFSIKNETLICDITLKEKSHEPKGSNNKNKKPMNTEKEPNGVKTKLNFPLIYT